MRNLAGGGLGAARFGDPHRELRSARWLVVQPGPDALHTGGGGGFAALEAGCRRVAGVSWF